ncbi:MAG: DUF998 domain-containing protein [Thermomicrobiales bacterium]
MENRSLSRQFTIACLWVGVLIPFFFVPMVILAGRMTPRYGHMSSTFSDASSQGSPHPGYMITGLVFVSLALGFCGFGFAHTLPRYARSIQISMALTAISILMTAVLRDYNRSPWVPRNREGMLHNTFATVAVFAILSTLFLISLAVRGNAAWTHLSIPGLAAFTIVAVAGLTFTWGPDSHDGLAERILAAAAFLYLAAVALNALSLIRGAPLRSTLFQSVATAQPAPAQIVFDD